MTDRIQFITHEGKQILLVDLSNSSAAEVEKTCRALPDVVTTLPRSSVLALTDFTGASFDAEVIRVLKETAAFDKPFVKKSAFVGTENFPPEFSENLSSFSRRAFPAFKTREEALAWLAKDRIGWPSENAFVVGCHYLDDWLQSERELKGGQANAAAWVLSSTRGVLPLVNYVVNFAQELRREEWLFQNVCAITQFGKLITKAGYKQELRFGACRTNSFGKLKPVEIGQDNISNHNLDCPLMSFAPVECLCTIGGWQNRKPIALKRPLQKLSKDAVVFDYQDGNGTAVRR
jgi:hypothetical protein